MPNPVYSITFCAFLQNRNGGFSAHSPLHGYNEHSVRGFLDPRIQYVEYPNIAIQIVLVFKNSFNLQFCLGIPEQHQS